MLQTPWKSVKGTRHPNQIRSIKRTRCLKKLTQGRPKRKLSKQSWSSRNKDHGSTEIQGKTPFPPFSIDLLSKEQIRMRFLCSKIVQENGYQTKRESMSSLINTSQICSSLPKPIQKSRLVFKNLS